MAKDCNEELVGSAGCFSEKRRFLDDDVVCSRARAGASVDEGPLGHFAACIGPTDLQDKLQPPQPSLQLRRRFS